MKDYSNYYPSFNEYIENDGKAIFERQKYGLDGKVGLIDGVEYAFVFRVSSNEYNEQYEQRVIVCDTDIDLHRGSEIYVDGDYWLVISEVDTNIFTHYAKVQKCNNTISKQGETGNIHIMPCIYSRSISQNSDGTDSNKYNTTSDVVAGITISCIDVTKSLIKVNDRFILNGFKFYEVRDIEISEKPGLMDLKLIASERQADDRLDLNIANYVDVEQPSETGYSIILNGDDTIKAFGYDYTYVATVYLDEVEVTNKDVAFTLIDTNNLATVNSVDDKTCILTTNNSQETGVITLRCELVDDGSVVVEKVIEVIDKRW